MNNDEQYTYFTNRLSKLEAENQQIKEQVIFLFIFGIVVAYNSYLLGILK